MANGLFSNTELIDSLITDCNDVVGALVSGNNIKFCKIVHEMVVKLVNLKNGITNDMANREQTIETLKEQLRNLGQNVADMTPEEFTKKCERDGADDGNNTNKSDL